MKNLSTVVRTAEAIEQLVIILEPHEAEEKDKAFLQRKYERSIGLDLALRRRFDDS
jgi:hypothetical protein